jgi:hypothetical protein
VRPVAGTANPAKTDSDIAWSLALGAKLRLKLDSLSSFLIHSLMLFVNELGIIWTLATFLCQSDNISPLS